VRRIESVAIARLLGLRLRIGGGLVPLVWRLGVT
jgi:hypothetical protein